MQNYLSCQLQRHVRPCCKSLVERFLDVTWRGKLVQAKTWTPLLLLLGVVAVPSTDLFSLLSLTSQPLSASLLFSTWASPQRDRLTFAVNFTRFNFSSLSSFIHFYFGSSSSLFLSLPLIILLLTWTTFSALAGASSRANELLCNS